jgi:hypothetical protein
MKRIIGIILLLALTNVVYAETAPAGTEEENIRCSAITLMECVRLENENRMISTLIELSKEEM